MLRDEWGFTGFVTSDWVFGTHDAVASLQAGMDVEMPLRLRRARELPSALRSGALTRAIVLRSAHRILRTGLLHDATRDDARAGRRRRRLPGASGARAPRRRRSRSCC